MKNPKPETRSPKNQALEAPDFSERAHPLSFLISNF
jgi:hypothetical protein